MASTDLPERLKRLEIPGRVFFLEGSGEKPKIGVIGSGGRAEIYLHGAQVTHYQKNGEDPLLFLSNFSRFAPNQPIRGGVPIVFPWFGPREGEPMHGFARLESWELKATSMEADGTARLSFLLPECPEAASFPPFTLEYVVAISDQLQLETIVTNRAPDTDFTFEICLHSYFSVSDISTVTVSGLKGASYLDRAEPFTSNPKVEANDPIKIASEVDRVYLNTPATVEIHDPGKRRRVRIQKSGSASTVLWNPWIAKAQQMPDFGNDEYLCMLCVESGNVGPNKITLAPGQTSRMTVGISSEPLKK